MRSHLRPFFDWYAHTPLAHTMSNSKVLIASAQIVHLVGMTLLIGAIMMVDLTMLGFGIKRHPVQRVAKELAPWTAAGLVILLLTGPLNLASEAMKCYDATFFWIKMGLLVIAIAFHFTVHRRVAMADPPASAVRAGVVACVSLALWFGIALSAKFIGFIGDDLRQASSGHKSEKYFSRFSTNDLRMESIAVSATSGNLPAIVQARTGRTHGAPGH